MDIRGEDLTELESIPAVSVSAARQEACISSCGKPISARSLGLPLEARPASRAEGTMLGAEDLHPPRAGLARRRKETISLPSSGMTEEIAAPRRRDTLRAFHSGIPPFGDGCCHILPPTEHEVIEPPEAPWHNLPSYMEVEDLRSRPDGEPLTLSNCVDQWIRLKAEMLITPPPTELMSPEVFERLVHPSRTRHIRLPGATVLVPPEAVSDMSGCVRYSETCSSPPAKALSIPAPDAEDRAVSFRCESIRRTRAGRAIPGFSPAMDRVSLGASYSISSFSTFRVGQQQVLRQPADGFRLLRRPCLATLSPIRAEEIPVSDRLADLERDGRETISPPKMGTPGGLRVVSIRSPGWLQEQEEERGFGQGAEDDLPRAMSPVLGTTSIDWSAGSQRWEQIEAPSRGEAISFAAGQCRSEDIVRPDQVAVPSPVAVGMLSGPRKEILASARVSSSLASSSLTPVSASSRSDGFLREDILRSSSGTPISKEVRWFSDIPEPLEITPYLYGDGEGGGSGGSGSGYGGGSNLYTKFYWLPSITLSQLLKKHSGHGYLDSLWFLDPAIDGVVAKYDNLVLVLIDNRLLEEEVRPLTDPKDRHVPASQFLSSTANYHPLPSYDLDPSLKIFRDDISKTTCDHHDFQKSWAGKSGKTTPYYFKSCMIKVKLTEGKEHVDGETLLYLREFLRDVRSFFINLRGVILVGAFPDALIVRRYGMYCEESTCGIGLAVSLADEIMTYRADIVLADLDGNWEKLYVKKTSNKLSSTFNINSKGKSISEETLHVEDYFLLDDSFKYIKYSSKILPKTFEVSGYDKFGKKWDETNECWKFPHIVGGKSPSYKSYGLIFFRPSGINYVVNKTISCDYTDANGKQQTDNVNTDYYLVKDVNKDGTYTLEEPLSIPDIIVSRINARNIAFSVDPRNYVYPGSPPVTSPWSYLYPFWYDGRCYRMKHDPFLERHLLIQFFERNHNYRQGRSVQRRCSGISQNWPSEEYWASTDLTPAFKEFWAGTNVEMKRWEDCALSDSYTCDFYSWLDTPAIIRTITNHGSFNSIYMEPERKIIRKVYPFYVKKEKRYLYVGAKLEHLRTFWEIKRKNFPQLDGSFYTSLSSYCLSPWNAYKEPYNSVHYVDGYFMKQYDKQIWDDKQIWGDGQIGEALLFYADGLAMFARAHSVHQSPMREFAEYLGQTKYIYTWLYYDKIAKSIVKKVRSLSHLEYELLLGYTFGEAWRGRFEHEQADACHKFFKNEIEFFRKESYRYCLIGDWTLRLNY